MTAFACNSHVFLKDQRSRTYLDRGLTKFDSTHFFAIYSYKKIAHNRLRTVTFSSAKNAVATCR